MDKQPMLVRIRSTIIGAVGLPMLLGTAAFAQTAVPTKEDATRALNTLTQYVDGVESTRSVNPGIHAPMFIVLSNTGPTDKRFWVDSVRVGAPNQ